MSYNSFCDNYIIIEICNDNTTEKYKKKHLKEILKKKRFTIDVVENELINAIQKEYYDLAILFLKNNVNINTYNNTDNNVKSVLNYAIDNPITEKQSKFLNILYQSGAVNGFIASLDNETLFFTLIQDEQYIKNYKYVDTEEKLINVIEHLSLKYSIESYILSYCILKGYIKLINLILSFTSIYILYNMTKKNSNEKESCPMDIIKNPYKYHELFNIPFDDVYMDERHIIYNIIIFHKIYNSNQYPKPYKSFNNKQYTI